jgi:hypothetical protein
LLETRELVCERYNLNLVLAGVVVNRVERTVEHRASLAEIASFFGPELVWAPVLLKRTVLQDTVRRGQPFGTFADAPRRSYPLTSVARTGPGLRVPSAEFAPRAGEPQISPSTSRVAGGAESGCFRLG